MERIFGLIQEVRFSATIRFPQQSEWVEAIRPRYFGCGLQTPIATLCQSDKRRMELEVAGKSQPLALFVERLARDDHPRELRQYAADAC